MSAAQSQPPRAPTQSVLEYFKSFVSALSSLLQFAGPVNAKISKLIPIASDFENWAAVVSFASAVFFATLGWSMGVRARAAGRSVYRWSFGFFALSVLCFLGYYWMWLSVKTPPLDPLILILANWGTVLLYSLPFGFFLAALALLISTLP